MKIFIILSFIVARTFFETYGFIPIKTRVFISKYKVQIRSQSGFLNSIHIRRGADNS